QKRKQVVQESLNSLGINCSDSVPHVALLGSGGGQRAAVALLGSLYQMQKEGLLDTVLYLGGVSGSTCDPWWSSNMERAVSRLSGPDVSLDEALAWLGQRAEGEDFSLSDIWGVLTSAGIMKQVRGREERKNDNNKLDYIYRDKFAHIKKKYFLCFHQMDLRCKWFEVTPHEAGFTELGLFIETSHLGSKFQAGQLLEERPEMDMVELQGVFSWFTQHILPLVLKWEWGTTRNFLYQYQGEKSLETFHLIDAGLLINVAYPSFLGDKRDIDLIIAPEYSAGNIFETVTLARDYAAKVNKPFPEIDDKVLEDKDWPKDCYVFQGEGKQPTIVYMPLFNRNNCKGLSPLQIINFLLGIAKNNMKNNKETILREINKAVERRQNKR
uniref:PLA2c domain-containing protein n=1 Tax=Myripristis murdjan TaxID=586833 RepID=A0A668ARM4_9TELE